MNYHVHAVEQDMAGKWYARVVISDEEAIFVKFDEFPTMPAIQEAATAAAEARQVQLERARDEQGRFVGDDPATPAVNEAWVEVSDGTAQ